MEETQAKEFGERVLAVVRSFVRTVLIIDDDWPDGSLPPVAETLAAPPESLIGPDATKGGAIDDAGASGGAGAGGVEDDASQFAVPPALAGGGEEDEDQWKLMRIARTVTNSGALFCGMRYGGASLETLRERAIGLAKRADVVILDWHLVGTSSDDALAILKQLYRDGGLRFVCVYTAQERLGDVRGAIKDALGTEPEGDGSDFRIGNMNIAVRSKPSSMVGGDPVEPENLFNTAVQAIAKTYRGLVQLALLELTTRHRDQLPQMLARFGADTDAAFVYEALNTVSPIGPSGPFLALMLDEWRALLEASVAGSPMRILSMAGLKEFLRARYIERVEKLTVADVRAHLQRTLGPENGKPRACEESIVAAIEEWVLGGLNGETPVPKSGTPWKTKELEPAKWGLLRAVLEPPGTGGGIENAFLPLMNLEVLFQQQRDLPSRLNQGTVLRYGSERYLVCITPACDAARADAKIGNTFSFLAGKRVEITGTGSHDGMWIVVNDGGVPVALSIEEKPVIALRVPDGTLKRDSEMVAFGSFPPGIAVETDQPIQLMPVAQLRVDHALALAQSAAAEAGRVGLDRGEFIRSRFRSA